MHSVFASLPKEKKTERKKERKEKKEKRSREVVDKVVGMRLFQ